MTTIEQTTYDRLQQGYNRIFGGESLPYPDQPRRLLGLFGLAGTLQPTSRRTDISWSDVPEAVVMSPLSDEQLFMHKTMFHEVKGLRRIPSARPELLAQYDKIHRFSVAMRRGDTVEGDGLIHEVHAHVWVHADTLVAHGDDTFGVHERDDSAQQVRLDRACQLLFAALEQAEAHDLPTMQD